MKIPIQIYACSGCGNGKQYRSFLSDEETSSIMTFMNNFYNIAKIAATQTGCILVWIANEMCKVGKLSD